MKQKTENTALKIVLKFVSALLAAVFLLSTLGAVAVSGVRRFFGEGEFEEMVDDLDLNEVKFTSNGKTYTASDYIYEAVAEVMPDSIKNYTGILNSLFGNTADFVLEEIISSETVNSIVKTTMMDCVDYYLNSDAKEARERLDSEKQIVDNTKDYENVKTVDEAVRVYVRSFVINTIENTSKMSSDQIIVLLSKDTVNLLTAVAVVSAILLIICNLGCIFDLLLDFGGASLIFGIVIKVLQGKFESSQTDKSLIGYQMLKPLVDSFSPNAIAGIVVGILLIGLFFALFILSKSQSKATETEIAK